MIDFLSIRKASFTKLRIAVIFFRKEEILSSKRFDAKCASDAGALYELLANHLPARTTRELLNIFKQEIREPLKTSV